MPDSSGGMGGNRTGLGFGGAAFTSIAWTVYACAGNQDYHADYAL